MSEEVGYFRSTNGIIHEFRLPLAEHFQDQADKRQLVRVNKDGSAFGGEADTPVKPNPGSSKALWVGWAVYKGLDPDEAEALTRNDLAEMFKED